MLMISPCKTNVSNMLIATLLKSFSKGFFPRVQSSVPHKTDTGWCIIQYWIDFLPNLISQSRFWINSFHIYDPSHFVSTDNCTGYLVDLVLSVSTSNVWRGIKSFNCNSTPRFLHQPSTFWSLVIFIITAIICIRPKIVLLLKV